MNYPDFPENPLQFPGQETETALDAEQVLHQLERILESRHLRQAKSLENFLRYVVAKRLAGEENDLKEYTLGVDVFRRGADFDPRKDSVVRVQANVLRKRLAGYYEDEGRLDEIIIEIPKGRYVPQFHWRSLIAGLKFMPGDTTNPGSREASQSAFLLSAGAGVRWKTVGLVAVTFVLGLATAMLWQGRAGKRVLAVNEGTGATTKASIDPAYLPLWRPFLEPGAENILAYGTPQFFVSSGLYLRDVEVNSPQESDIAERIQKLQRTMHTSFAPTEVYTGVGEAHGVYLLTKFFGKVSSDLRVTRSRMVGWNELKNANVIFLSSMRFHTLAKELPYPTDFSIHSGVSSKITNLHPRPGEPKTYGGDGDDVYAVVTVWPGKLNQRRILVLSGSTTWATLAAAEYVTDPEYLRQLNPHLERCRTQSSRAQHPSFFQVLLRADVKDNQPVSISYVTHHDFELADAEAPEARANTTEHIARASSQK